MFFTIYLVRRRKLCREDDVRSISTFLHPFADPNLTLFVLVHIRSLQLTLPYEISIQGVNKGTFISGPGRWLCGQIM
jgi:hypothetical protein